MVIRRVNRKKVKKAVQSSQFTTKKEKTKATFNKSIAIMTTILRNITSRNGRSFNCLCLWLIDDVRTNRLSDLNAGLISECRHVKLGTAAILIEPQNRNRRYWSFEERYAAEARVNWEAQKPKWGGDAEARVWSWFRGFNCFLSLSLSLSTSPPDRGKRRERINSPGQWRLGWLTEMPSVVKL